MIKKISLKKFLPFIDNNTTYKGEICPTKQPDGKISFSCWCKNNGENVFIFSYKMQRQTAEKFIAETAAKGYKIRQLPK